MARVFIDCVNGGRDAGNFDLNATKASYGKVIGTRAADSLTDCQLKTAKQTALADPWVVLQTRLDHALRSLTDRSTRASHIDAMRQFQIS